VQPPLRSPASINPPGTLGNAPGDTPLAIQSDLFKELVNKIAWVLGSCYKTPYTNNRTTARTYAIKLATVTIRDHGYPPPH